MGQTKGTKFAEKDTLIDVPVTTPMWDGSGVPDGTGADPLGKLTRTWILFFQQIIRRLRDAGFPLIVAVNDKIIGSEPELNFITGPNITITGVDVVDKEKIDLTISSTGGGGGGTVPTWVEEVPTGALNGSNVSFTLTNTPIAGSLTLFLNIVQMEGTDFTIAGGAITFTVAPKARDTGYFLARYQY